MFNKARHIGEVVLLAMLEYKQSTGFQHSLFKNQARNGGQFGQGIRWVGKYQVELLLARLYESEHVATYQYVVVGVELLHTLADERSVVAVHLNTHHGSTAARQQFERNATRTCKKVESIGSLHVDITVYYIKDILLCEIGCGTRLKRTWNVEMASLVYTSYYSHSLVYILMNMLYVLDKASQFLHQLFKSGYVARQT